MVDTIKCTGCGRDVLMCDAFLYPNLRKKLCPSCNIDLARGHL